MVLPDSSNENQEQVCYHRLLRIFFTKLTLIVSHPSSNYLNTFLGWNLPTKSKKLLHDENTINDPSRRRIIASGIAYSYCLDGVVTRHDTPHHGPAGWQANGSPTTF